MIKWIDNNTLPTKIPRDRALLAYVPGFNKTGYEVVTWNGANFESELHGEEIHDYVEKWCLILEAD